MGKRNMGWSIDMETGILTCTHADAGDKTQDCPLVDLFEDFAELDFIQKNLIAYGAKQKLADSVASEKKLELTANERIVTMDGIWARLKEGVWSQKGGGVRNTLKKQLQEGMDSISAEEKAAIPEAVAEMMKKYGIKL